VSLEGWVPDVGDYLTLAEVVEFAFDYRGNTTIVKRDGTILAAVGGVSPEANVAKALELVRTLAPAK